MNSLSYLGRESFTRTNVQIGKMDLYATHKIFEVLLSGINLPNVNLLWKIDCFKRYMQLF